jgi:predicted Zn-dependent protease
MRRYLAALAVTGQTEKAVAELQAVLVTDWYRAESWQLLAKYFTSLGRTDEAAKALAQAHAFDVHLTGQ